MLVGIAVRVEKRTNNNLSVKDLLHKTNLRLKMPDINKYSSDNEFLTQDKLHEIGGYTGSTHGTQLIARFCNAINRGAPPSENDLKEIAYALEPLKTFYQKDIKTTDNRLRDALDEFARRMSLKKKQGKAGSESFANSEYMTESVARHLRKVTELVSSGCSESEAEKQALNWSSENEKIGPKAMKNRIKKYMAMAETLNNMLQCWK